MALTHWGRVTHICVSKLTILGSDNGLSPGRHQAIIWTNAKILLIEPLGTNFSEFLIGIRKFSFKKMRLKMSSAKWRPFCLGLNELSYCDFIVKVCSIRYDIRLQWPILGMIWHYNDVVMNATASQIISLTIVYPTVYSGADQRKHQSSASLAFVRGIHRSPVNSPHKCPVTRKMFSFDDVIMAPNILWYTVRYHDHKDGITPAFITIYSDT